MALPLIPLAVRAGLALAKNKKARELLTKSVGGFLNRRQNLAPLLRRGRKESPSLKALTGFPGGAAIGAGTSTVIMDKKLQEAKRNKKTNQSESKPKDSLRRFRRR